MPFLVSVPKNKSATTTQHRKVTVESIDDDGVTFNMKEMLLACGAEPADVLPLVGFDTVDTLMKLSGIWDVVIESYASCPTMYDDSVDSEPVMKMCKYLLVNNLHPDMLSRHYADTHKENWAAMKHLLELQRNWADIKANHAVAEPVCDFCGCAGAVLRCSGCMLIRKEVRYCDKECQTGGWKQHKKDGCGQFASDKAKKRVAKACGK
jgi:hypothetical protein